MEKSGSISAFPIKSWPGMNPANIGVALAWCASADEAAAMWRDHVAPVQAKLADRGLPAAEAARLMAEYTAEVRAVFQAERAPIKAARDRERAAVAKIVGACDG